MRIADLRTAERYARAKDEWTNRLEIANDPTLRTISVVVDRGNGSITLGNAASISHSVLGGMGLPSALAKRIVSTIATYCHDQLVAAEAELREMGIEFTPYNAPDRDADDTSGIIS